MAADSNLDSFSNLRELEDAIRIAELDDVGLQTENFIVLCINRYLTDPEFKKQTNSDTSQVLDVHDITLADTSTKRKLLLSNKLNFYVQQNKLRVGSTVCLNKCKARFDETDLQAESLIIIEELHVTGQKTAEDFIESYDLPWYPESNVRQTGRIPIASGRGSYVSVWTSSDVVVPESEDTVPAQNDVDEPLTLDLCCIKELATRWGRIQSTKPPILVRVVRKSRLLNYAKPDKTDKWPFQHHLLVCDKSGYCTVVLWNVVCLQYLKQIKEGSVLMLRNFTVKKSFSINYQWHIQENGLDLYPIDLNMNAHHPKGEILILNNRSLPSLLRLAELKYRLITRNQLSSLPDNVVCDIAGVVVYVGRVEREATKGRTQGDSGGFWLRRWVHIRDHTHNKPFILQMYRGQDAVFDSLKPHQVVMCRHVRVRHNLASLHHSRQHRHIYVTTTALSQCVTSQHALSPSVRAWMINLSRRLNDMDLDMSVGGYFSYPPLPHSLAELKSLHPNIMITPCSAWRETLERCSYMQHIRLYVQAKLAAVKFHGLETTMAQGKSKKKQKGNPLETVVNADTHQNIDRFDSVGDHEVSNSHLCPVDYHRGDKLTWINLPATDQPKPEVGGPRFQESEEMFVTTWQGLNTRVLLHSLRDVSCVNFPKRTDFADFLEGKYDTETSQEGSEVSVLTVRQLLHTAENCHSQRFLVVLDLYRDSDTHVEVVLNRAYVL
ncbi:RPA-related protein RADX-like [Haliotis cracherodii]|uniref:RPA-related protein RADX-like n=1 Tax=Haliotis cracherodii TaxID=6455 RepID=UPI0039E8C3C8